MKGHKTWLVFRPDGGWEQFTAHPENADDHPRLHYPDDHEFVAVDRHTTDPLGERYDRRKKAWVKVELTDEQKRDRERAEMMGWTPPQLVDYFEERLADLERRLKGSPRA